MGLGKQSREELTQGVPGDNTGTKKVSFEGASEGMTASHTLSTHESKELSFNYPDKVGVEADAQDTFFSGTQHHRRSVVLKLQHAQDHLVAYLPQRARSYLQKFPIQWNRD